VNMNAISSAIKAGHGNGILLAGIVGLILSDIIPTPGDALYFWDQQRLRQNMEKGSITVKAYWRKNAEGYYLFNSGWWLLTGIIVMKTGKTFDQKLKIMTSLISAGAVIAVILKNIKKDEQFRTDKRANQATAKSM
jgi:xanthine/uracil permease